MNKRILVLIFACVFLFGQIAVLQIANWFFDFNSYSAFVVTLVWASAILCGYFSHWAMVYLDKIKNLEVR